jgi:hypothetical protein
MTKKRKSKPRKGVEPITRWHHGQWLGLLIVALGSILAWAAWSRDRPVRDATDDTAAGEPPAATAIASAGTTEAVLPVRVQGSWDEIDNPARDGWMIEVHADHAKHVLSDLAEMMIGRAEISAPAVQAICDEGFRATGFLPSHLQVAFRDEVFQVEREGGRDERLADAPVAFHGGVGCVAAAQQMARFWSAFHDRRYEVKVFRSVEESGDLVTHQYLTAAGRSSDKSVEQHATWVVRWMLPAATDQATHSHHPLRLRSIEVVDFEQTTVNTPRPLLVDTTAAMLENNECYASQFLFGMNHWLDRTQDLRYFSPLGNPGLAVGDVNGDGLEDLYVCQEANLPNRLFLQQPDGTARDVAADWKVDWLAGSRSVLLVDLDNDGDQDLVVAILGGVVIASHEGDRFAVRDVLTTHDDTTSLSAVDYDLDGDLDLYVCVDYPNDYFASASEVPVQGGAANRVYHDANGAGRNSLFRNELDTGSAGSSWRFVDATDETGLDQNNRRFSWAASWEDYDNDGDQDLYVANDFGRNNLYENRNGQFVDVAKTARAEDSASGMSAAWADTNRDGMMDLYVGNMFSSAGGRITYQPAFKPNADEEIRHRLQRFARGSSLFRNLGNATFDDISVDAGVTVGRWAWSSNFLDINNDGWRDIAVANGYITADDTGDL